MVLAVAFGAAAESGVWTPGQMPNVNVKNRYDFVSDPGNLLSPETKQAVNQRLWDLRQQTTVEAVVALPPDIGDETIEEWSEQLFTLWGIGKKDKDNGVLLVIAPAQRRARIQTGYGVEGTLPDIACMNIIQQAIIPNMRQDDINAAVNDASRLMCDALTDPSVAEELRSNDPDNYSGEIDTLDPEVIWLFLEVVATIFFIITLASFCYLCVKARKLDTFGKANMWRKNLTALLIGGILSLGSGLIFYLLALLFYRRARTRRRRCPQCGTKMRRLNEQEDNALLSPAQDLEEQLDTIDYDVWQCPKCGTVERLPFPSKQTKYTECPKCHTVAMSLVADVILQPATTRHAGIGEKIYRCQFCGYERRERYTIPRKDDGSALAAAALGAAAASAASRRGGGGFGGGGFGGGFGGGSTGGGGASGGW